MILGLSLGAVTRINVDALLFVGKGVRCIVSIKGRLGNVQ
jgi:hypothetical protein